MNMEDKMENSLLSLINVLEQAENAALRKGDFVNLNALGQLHLVALHFYEDESNAVSEGLANVYCPDSRTESDSNE